MSNDARRPSATRLRAITEDQLTPAARRVWDAVTRGRRGSAAELTTPAGGLVGPFNAMLYSPVAGERYAALGEAIRYDTALPRRLRELATIVVGAHWRSNFEWAAHADLARAAGIPDDAIAALARGDVPVFSQHDETIVHYFCRALLEDGRVQDEVYAAAVAELGEPGVVELTMVAGYYTLICFTLNAFEVPVPEGVTPAWP